GGLIYKPTMSRTFGNQQRVRREFERLAPVRLQAEGAPYATDRHMTEAGRLRHLARAPVRRPRGVVSTVRTITSSILASVIWRGVPGRGSSNSPATRSVTNRARHLHTRARAAPVAPARGPTAIDGPAIPILLVPP